MTIDDFLKKHEMTAYQFAQLTGWQQSQLSRYRSGAIPWSRHHDFFLDALDFAIEHGFKKNARPAERMKGGTGTR